MSSAKRIFFFLVFSPQILCGCSVWKTIAQRREKRFPRMIVLPFACENGGIGSKITGSLVENVDRRIEAFDEEKFELLLSSISRNRSLQANADPSKDPSLEPIISFSSAAFFRDLVNNEMFRTKVNIETRLDYAVAGSAREKKLSELEAGNLVTAETAEMKLLELKTGKILLAETFKQGSFEITAPDRIGSKFAAKVNKKLKEIRKQNQKIEKELERTMSLDRREYGR
jgi:hypothetical protein